MKTITSCDDVFETLTAGPFPTGSEQDSSIREHLTVCRSCKELAEALRPACNLMRESLSDVEKMALPVYRDAEEQQLCASVQRIMRELQAPDTVGPQVEPRRYEGYWSTRFLGSLCVTLLVLLLASGARKGNSDPSPPSDPSHLDSMQLAEYCVEAKQPIHTRATSHDYLCCTQCHNGTSQGIETRASELLIACRACHN